MFHIMFSLDFQIIKLCCRIDRMLWKPTRTFRQLDVRAFQSIGQL